MLKLRRVCVPLGLDCNLQCKYCYRDLEKIDNVPDFTPDMIEYLSNLDPSWCEAVIASGGEPLLHWDKVLELFSYVPNNIHKVIMTNGILLTQEIVDYVNKNKIEVHLSHDGAKTKFLRGIDIFDNERLLTLSRQIETLYIFAVVTKYNNDVWENYFNTVFRLKRANIFYNFQAIGDNNIPEQQDLIDGFDYNLYAKTYIEFNKSPCNVYNPYRQGHSLKNDPYKNNKYFAGFNVLPNGIICGMARICSQYGTIHSTYEELINKLHKIEHIDKCDTCEYNDRCFPNYQLYSDHTCKVNKAIINLFSNKDFMNKVYERTNNIIGIIKEYGYTE